MASAVKAFLCSQDGSLNFPLMPKLTTIGRENCDIIIMNNTLDSQHAVIEYHEEENVYSISDLNSINGTYINENRIGTESVRLNEQDCLKFGLNGHSFQICMQQIITTIPPIGMHRQSYAATGTQLINQSRTGMLPIQNINGFWLSPDQIPNGSFISITNQPPISTQITQVKRPQKNPVQFRSRPSSSQSQRREQINASPFSGQNEFQGRFVGNETYRRDNFEERTLKNELEQIICSKHSIERELKERELEIKDLKQKAGLSIRIEKELKDKEVEVRDLKHKIDGMKEQIASNSEQIKELEQAKKDKSAATGLVNTLKKELSNKEIAHEKLTKEVKSLKEQINSYSTQFKEIASQVELLKTSMNDKEAENERLRRDYKTLQEDDSKAKLIKELDQLKREKSIANGLFNTMKQDLADSASENGKLTENVNQLTQKLSEKYKIIAELEEKVNDSSLLDELKTKYNKLRLAVIQSVCTMTGNNEMSDEADDEELVTRWRAAAEDCVEQRKNVDDLTKNLGITIQSQSDTLDNIRELNKKIGEIETEMEAGSFGLEKALEMVESHEYHNHLAVVKEMLITQYENQIKRVVKLGQEHDSKVVELTLHHSENIATLQEELNALNVTHEATKSEYESKLTDMNNSVSELNAQIETYILEINTLKSDLSTAKEQDQTEVLKEQMKELETRVLRAEENYNQKTNDIELKLKNVENSYNVEISIHKEQIKQHALTIVKFEKDIIRYKNQEQRLVEKIENYEKNPPAPVRDSVEIITSEQARKQIDAANKECYKYKKRMTEQDEIIKTLRRDLEGASAKLSDTHGEMTDKQKRELEKNKQMVQDQQKELSVTRAQLAKLSEIVERQTEQLDSVNPELTKANELVEKYRTASEENGLLAVELKSKLEHVENELRKFDAVKCEEGKITSELTAAGAQCRGERHEQVISRQREALNDLRQRIKTLEQTRPQQNNHQQQLQQQVMLLKKQLAEVRASQALNEDIVKHVNINRGQDENNYIIEEKTAHYETQTALESSEESYLTLLKTISCLLGITELDGLRSMVDLPSDERFKLITERTKSIDTIVQKIKMLIEKLQRKEDILKDYEIDLAKLRQAEFLLEKKSEQLDESHLNSRNKDDEIECLKQSLMNTRTELDRVKLVNSAIKNKKTVNSIPLPINSARRGSTDTLHHHCKPDDSYNQNQIKKVMNEKIKRKDFELKTLKKEIKDKTDELSHLSKNIPKPV